MALQDEQAPANMAKAAKDLKESKAGFEKAHKLFLKGRTIEQAENQAKSTVEAAKLEVAKLIADANKTQQEAKDELTEAKLIKSQAKSDSATALGKVKAANKAALEVEAAFKEIESKAQEAQDTLREANKLKSMYEGELDKLHKFLGEILG
jgi:hypothetical protein